MVATRTQVYEAIDSERTYQDGLWPQDENRSPDTPNPLTIGEFLLLVEQYASLARTEWTSEKEPAERTLNVIRKIAGIAVNCMEQHGAPLRVPESLFTPEVRIMGMPTIFGTLYPSRRRIADADRRQGSAQRRGAQRRYQHGARRAPALVSARRAGDKPYPDRRHLTDRRAHINTGRRSPFTPDRRKT